MHGVYTELDSVLRNKAPREVDRLDGPPISYKSHPIPLQEETKDGRPAFEKVDHEKRLVKVLGATVH